MAKAKRKDKLQRKLKFTESDLEANRSGFITPQQNHQIRQETVLRMLNYLSSDSRKVLAILLYLTLLLVLSKVSTLATVIFLIVGCFMAWHSVSEHWTDYRSDIANSSVVAVNGALWLYQGNRKTYYLIMNNQSFEVSKEIYKVFADYDKQRQWTIYYLPQTRLVLSAESL